MKEEFSEKFFPCFLKLIENICSGISSPWKQSQRRNIEFQVVLHKAPSSVSSWFKIENKKK